MASASRFKIPVKLVLSGIASSIILPVAYTVHHYGLKHILVKTLTGPGSWSRIIALLIILANLKNFPGVWHFRVFNAIFSHLEFTRTKRFTPTRTPNHPFGPAALFQPVITQSHSPVTECDYNAHKSNSTYFTDLDVTRSHLVTCLLRQGIRDLVRNPGRVHMPDGSPAKGNWFIMLGAVTCSFKREIKPYEGYEMWTRLLCWDRKWIYILTHFVRKGTVKPNGYTLDDGSLASRFLGPRGRKGKDGEEVDNVDWSVGEANKNVFASALSKYCTKLGRFTIHPEVTLAASGLLPPRPGGWNTMSGETEEQRQAMKANEEADKEDWNWKRIEAENARGMKFAEQFAALDGLVDEFTGNNRPALGRFRDFTW